MIINRLPANNTFTINHCVLCKPGVQKVITMCSSESDHIYHQKHLGNKPPRQCPCSTTYLSLCFTHPVENGRPALLCDALKHCQHSKTNIIKGRDTKVGPNPQLQAGGDFRITDIGTSGSLGLIIRCITGCGHLSLCHYLTCNDMARGEGWKHKFGRLLIVSNDVFRGEIQ